jgi:hypothetical protein
MIYLRRISMGLWITVLDYSNEPAIRIHYAPELNAQITQVTDDKVEDWLCKHDNLYKESQCYYMFSESKPEVKYYGC